jgi:hypothetical protein
MSEIFDIDIARKVWRAQNWPVSTYQAFEFVANNNYVFEWVEEESSDLGPYIASYHIISHPYGVPETWLSQ